MATEDFEDEKTEKSETGKLVRVLGSGVILGCILIALLVYNYGNGPTVNLAQRTLIAPDMLTRLTFKKPSSRSKELTPYMVDRIEYRYENASTGKLGQIVTLKNYETFYDAIGHDKSIDANSVQVKGLNDQHISVLLIRVKPQQDFGLPSPDSDVFQQVQFFIGTDIYRIAKPRFEDTIPLEWVYFEHPHLFDLVETNLAH